MNKIIVVGAGIVGASTAYQLSKQNVEVVIVDRKDRGQATDAAAGIVCPWLSQRRNQAWYQLAKGGAKFYPSLIKELKQSGENNTGYAQVGALSLHKDKTKLTKLEERAVKRKEMAPEMGEITSLSEQATTSYFPPIDSEFSSVHVSGAARVDGRALREALLQAAQKNGAKLCYGSAELISEHNRVTGIQLETEVITADKIVVCTGAWGKETLKPLGIEFQVSFQKAQIIHLNLPDANTNDWPVLMPPGNQYVLAFDNGRIVAGATHEDTETYDTRVTAGGLHEVFNKALETVPGIADGTFVEARTGFRPFTPGFLPVFGQVPEWENLFIANGLGASGLTMGPYIGSELTKIILGFEPEIDVSAYSVDKALKQ
ncbi:FAD-binding oxidoreductase [Mesobacillus maritimus]|uniref:NAD(P)/FAD-dependent oxidoreductase n=1 Tax=Mesobacillus maritimus TaxID=1643336 RepID=UPI002041BA41|nr:FAD-binding oxidoreductase [Mesobacillus maritimus]MCM3670401.1 FAD-binding oxidoreductase [Mesobacillus maritimus]